MNGKVNVKNCCLHLLIGGVEGSQSWQLALSQAITLLNQTPIPTSSVRKRLLNIICLTLANNSGSIYYDVLKRMGREGDAK